MKILSLPAKKGSHGVIQAMALYIDHHDFTTAGVAEATEFGDVLPQGAIVIGCWHQVLEAFNSSVSDLLIVGDDGDDDRYKAAGDINEALAGALTFKVSGYQATVARTPKVTYTSTGVAPTTGKLLVILYFVEALSMP